MAEGKITEFWSLDELAANKAAAIALIKEGVAEVNAAQKAILSNNTISGSSENSSRAATALNELSLNLKVFADTTKQVEMLQAKLNVATSDTAKEQAKLSVQLSETNKQMRDAAQASNLDWQARQKSIQAIKDQAAADKQAAADFKANRALEIAGAKEALAVQKEVDRQMKEQAKSAELEAAAIAKAEKNVVDLGNAEQVLILKIKASEAAYKQAFLTQGEFDKQTIKLKDDTNALKAVQNTMNTAIGNYRSNVGNYTSAWNGLGNSINQITRELPNFAQSMQLGMLAISNNLPILQDELRNTKNEIAQLKLEGKEAPTLFSRIASAVFSWQTALVLAITVGMKLIEYFSKENAALKKSKQDVDDLKKAREQSYNSAIEGAAKEANSLEMLYRKATDVNLVMKDRVAAVDEMQKKYPNYFADITKETILVGAARDAYLELNGAILKRAEMEVFTDELNRITAALFKNEQKVRDARAYYQEFYNIIPNAKDKLAQAPSVYDSPQLKGLREATQVLHDNNVQLSEQEKLRRRIMAVSQETTKLEPRGKAGKVGKVAVDKVITKKELEDTSQVGTAIYTQITNEMALIGAEINYQMSLAQENLRKQLDSGVITLAQYEKQKLEIVKNGEAEILKLQKDRLGEILSGIGLSEEDTQKVLQLFYDKSIKLLEDETSAEEAELKTRVQIRARFDQIHQKNADESAEKDRKRIYETTKAAKLLARELATLTITLLNAQSQREVEELEKSQERTQKEYDLKREAVDKSFNNEAEKAAQKKVLDAEEAARTAGIEKQIKKQKRDQAIFEKALALAQITINTAVNASKAGNPVAAALYIAAGAVQAGIVAATPIPEFAVGKDADNPYTGKAWAGEAGPEVWVDKNGNMKLLTSRTLINTVKGDTILNQKQIERGGLQPFLQKETSHSNKDVVEALGKTNKILKHLNQGPLVIDNSKYYQASRNASR